MEPREVTEYEYDDAGRLVRSVTHREPEWTEEQQNLLLALGLYRSLVHEPCGGYLPDVTAPDADGAYRAEPPVRCHLCTARAQAYTAYTSGSHSPHPEALLWPVTRR